VLLLLLLLSSLFGLFPFLLKLYADSGYQGTDNPAGAATSLPPDQRRDRQALGFHPAHGQKALPENIMIPDRL